MKKYNEWKIKTQFINNILVTNSMGEALEAIEGDKPDIATIRNWRKKDIKFDTDVSSALSYKKKAKKFIESFEKQDFDVVKIFAQTKVTTLELGRWANLFPDFKNLMSSVNEGLDIESNLISKNIMRKFAEGKKKKESVKVKELASGKTIKEAKKESLEYQASKDIMYIQNRIGDREDEEKENSGSGGVITFKIETSGYPIEIDNIKYLMSPDGTLKRFISDD